MLETKRVDNYIDGSWSRSTASETIPVTNPATGETLAETPLGGVRDVDAAVAAATQAFQDWRRTPPEERIQYLFKFKELLEAHFEDIARSITNENGKTLVEARAELRAVDRER